MLVRIVKGLTLVLLMGLPVMTGATEMEDMSSAVEVVKKRIPVKIEGKKTLPLKILTRPFSNIYKDKNIESGIVQSDVSAMQPFYVYTRPSAEDLELEAGWYEIGTNSQGKVIGWMQSKDVFEWKQTMSLVYTHPEGRKPVLMFDSRSALNKILRLKDDERAKEVSRLYAAIDEHNLSKDFPVKSVEPKRAIDIQKEFYLLPILDFKAVEFGNREARVLQLTAVTNARAGARDVGDIRKSGNYVNEATEGSTEISAKKLKKLIVDIVWVMDTTVSMRPYVQDTMDFIRKTSTQLAETQSNNIKIKFGIWGYRDAVEDMPKIGYTTKNYTPELVDIEDFTDILSTVKVTEVDSVDYPEDMFSGVSDAMKKTAWSPEGMRLMILVGDAPSHRSGHKWNLSGQNEETLRSLANGNKIYIAALHINNPKAEKFNELAKTQYRTLATNPGTGSGDAAFYDILSTDKEAFEIKTGELAGHFKDAIQKLEESLYTPQADNPAEDNTTKRPVEGELAFLDENKVIDINEVIPEIHTLDTNMTGAASRMFRAAMVDWIGSQTGAKAPRDVVAWVIDKDLENPDAPSLEVRLLINKRQLDSLATTIESILGAGLNAQVAGGDFFASLKAATATIARDPNMVKQAKRMVDMGLIPEFLEGLPYKSQLMAISNELWSSWSADEQMEFLNALSSKVEAYRDIHNTPEAWTPLNKGDDIDEYVHPLSLDLLP